MYHLKIAFRNIWRNLLYSIINVTGLGVSLAAVILISLWVKKELSYDRFHKNAEHIYIGISHFRGEGETSSAEVTPGQLAPVALADFKEVANACRVLSGRVGYVRYEEKKTESIGITYADTSFFTMFNYPIVKGDTHNPLRHPSDVVISEHLAGILFGDADPIGQTVVLDRLNHANVVAVMQDLPDNTYVGQGDIVASFHIDTASYYTKMLAEWQGAEFLTFLHLHTGTDTEALAKQLSDKQPFEDDWRYFTLKPLVNMHLYDNDGNPQRAKTVGLFVLIAVALLVIGCVNYVNLVTARASRRHREIGVRKVVGASRRRLFAQLLTEAVVMFLFALVVATILIYLALPLYNSLAGKQMTIDWTDAFVWILYAGSLVAMTLLAGVYPAILLMSSNAIDIIQGEQKERNKGVLFRRILVVAQFACSVILIIGAITMNAQMTYMRNKNLGYDRENIFVVPLNYGTSHYEAIRTELLQQASVLDVSAASELILSVSSGHAIYDWEGKTSAYDLSVTQLRADTSFIRFMNIKLLNGKTYGAGEPWEIVINKNALDLMGLSDPVGKIVGFNGDARIAGVTEDFNFGKLDQPATPFVMFYTPWALRLLYVKTSGEKAAQAIAAVEEVWRRYNAELAFSYQFLDDRFDRMYRSEQRTGKLFAVFAVIAILVSCLGLFGLITYTAQAKTKEIGIRKVMGAGVGSIIAMLSREFFLLITIALLIAFPLAYYWLDNMLQDYAYRISISAGIFMLAAGITVVLTLLTVSVQAVKAATANPVKSIKSNE